MACELLSCEQTDISVDKLHISIQLSPWYGVFLQKLAAAQ